MCNTENETIKPYKELEFKDDFMFGVTMSDPELCHDVLGRLLQIPIGELREVQTQREFKQTTEGKPIRLDIYTRDDSAVYDAEMQNQNKRSIKSLALPKRTRYYQALIDTEYLSRRDDYSLLPDSYIVFICTFDPFGKNLASYTFTERCKECQELVLEDGTVKIFYNCSYDGKGVSEDIRRFYRYVETGDVTDELTARIDEAVVEARKKEEWESMYMKERTIIADAVRPYIEEAETYKKQAEDEKKRADEAEAEIMSLRAQLAASQNA